MEGAFTDTCRGHTVLGLCDFPIFNTGFLTDLDREKVRKAATNGAQTIAPVGKYRPR